jgi:hypothetical protein
MNNTTANISVFEGLQSQANASMGAPQAGLGIFNASSEAQKEFQRIKSVVSTLQSKATKLQSERLALLREAKDVLRKGTKDLLEKEAKRDSENIDKAFFAEVGKFVGDNDLAGSRSPLDILYQGAQVN